MDTIHIPNHITHAATVILAEIVCDAAWRIHHDNSDAVLNANDMSDESRQAWNDAGNNNGKSRIAVTSILCVL